MKVAIIAAPFVEVPPRKYGGSERILNYLCEELSGKVNLTLYCSGDSIANVSKKIICEKALFNDEKYNHSTDREKKSMEINKKIISLIDSDTDLINCHDYDNPDLIKKLSTLGIPVLVSIGHSITLIIQEIFSSHYPNVFFHGLSKSQLKSLKQGENLPVIYNGIKSKNIERGATLKYFLTIGDTKPIKGHKKAIELAKKTGLDMIIGGAPVYPESYEYFNTCIKPFIDVDASNRKEEFLEGLKNGEQVFGNGKIIYLGFVNDEEKRILFSNAMFTQFIGNLEVKGNIEACPLVPLESILFSVPVIGVKGSVTEELIQEGKTGINVSSVEEAIKRISEIEKMNRKEIRSIGLVRFSAKRMAEDYFKLYKKILFI